MNKSFHIITSLLMIFFFSTILLAQDSKPKRSAEQIAAEMEKIQSSTNWNDPAQSKKALQKIQELTKELTGVEMFSILSDDNSQMPKSKKDKSKKSTAENNQQQQDGNADEEKEQATFTREKVEALAWQLAPAGGDDQDILLAKDTEEEIKKAIDEEKSGKVTNNAYFEKLETILIDLSSPIAEMQINQLENYKDVKNLIITSSKKVTNADVIGILKKASKLPLQELYITRLGSAFTSIPKSINNFKNLKTLALYDNDIKNLIDEVYNFKDLEKLYVDKNPVSQISNSITKLKKLKELGIAQTNLTPEAIDALAKLLPNCQVVTK